MKKWSKPEIIDLSIEHTRFQDTGGANDGGYIANPNNSGNTHANQQVPGHNGHS